MVMRAPELVERCSVSIEFMVRAKVTQRHLDEDIKRLKLLIDEKCELKKISLKVFMTLFMNPKRAQSENYREGKFLKPRHESFDS
jgi:hypothetical protein